MQKFQVVCVGNVIIDAFLTLQKNNVFTKIDSASKSICFQYGQKIHVENTSLLLGGNACNVSVGLGRLGFETSLVAEIGDDLFAKKALEVLGKENVDITNLLQTPNSETSFTVGINYQEERTLFVQHIRRGHNFSFENATADWIYLTSLGDEWKSAYKKVLEWVQKEQVKIAFSPGTHQMECFDSPNENKEGSDILKEVLGNTQILFVNKEEGERIFNFTHSPSSGHGSGVARLKRSSKFSIFNERQNSQEVEIEELLKELQKLGPKIVSVTDGKNGSYALDESGSVLHLEAPQCGIVEKTGAGDAYATGFLGAAMSGRSIKEAMEWGSKNAAAVMGKVGAQPGLLDKSQI